MASCSDCGKEINSLILEEKTMTVFNAELYIDKNSIRTSNAAIVKTSKKYYCPLCNARLTRSEKRAIKILNAE